MLEHGGRLLRAARQYSIPAAQWLDLSTGVSPFAWPVPAIPASAWHRLPEDDDGLVDAASKYYGAAHVLPVAGSQAAIQALPLLRTPSRVGVIAPGYAEHAHAWRREGHRVTLVPAQSLLACDEDFDVLVLIHPNNPGGERFAMDDLLRLHAALAARGGWLIVDEAFIDVEPEHSLCAHSDREGLIVLRSIGKFFGMAGARAGFVCATQTLLDALRARLGPWAVSGPARFALREALADTEWQAKARLRLCEAGKRLQTLLCAHGIAPTVGCAFFQWWRHNDAHALHDALARQGVLTRRFEDPSSLRFGLPADDTQFARLDAALTEARR